MKIEKVLKRESGDKVVVAIETPSEWARDCAYRTTVSFIQKGKRKPMWCTNGYNFTETMMPLNYRSANLDERKKMIKDFVSQYVTMDELIEVRNELLEKMKVDNFEF